jgi:hypothetical protein
MPLRMKHSPARRRIEVVRGRTDSPSHDGVCGTPASLASRGRSTSCSRGVLRSAPLIQCAEAGVRVRVKKIMGLVIIRTD